MSFASWLFERRLKKNRLARKVDFPKYDDVKTVLVLLNDAMYEQNIVDFLSQDKKHVTVKYPPQKEQISFWTKKPAKEFLQTISAHSYDILLDLTSQETLAIQYMVLEARAAFRCGGYVKEGLFDMTVLKTDSPMMLAQEIVHYLKEIKAK